MTDDEPLSIAYERHERVRRLIDAIRYCLEGLSLSFADFDDPRAKGPGMYLAVVAGRSVAEYADPMGDNRWPVGTCRDVLADIDAFYGAATEVAWHHDGAVVVGVDGVIMDRMVRFRDLPEPGAYADWMGSRHMSALDTSKRAPVVATLTLSQESGRVTVFRDGEFDAVRRHEFAARWRDERQD